MSLHIKFSRKGEVKKAVYDIVVVQKQGPGLGVKKDKIGYSVGGKGVTGQSLFVSIKKEKLAFWLAQGIGLTKSLKKYLIKTKFGI